MRPKRPARQRLIVGLAGGPAGLLAALWLLGWLLPALAAADATPSRPNIVVLLADDLGYADLGCYGARDIRTPHLDRLARDGVRFTQFYANGPECSPTRTAFLTGRYQQRVGGLECAIGIGGVGRYDDAIRLAAQGQLGLPASEITIARLLRDGGYATALSGKWHLGYADAFSPHRHGFDHALYALGGGMDYFHHVEDPPAYTPVMRRDGVPVRTPGYATNVFADDAETWLRAHHARAPHQPFFLYVPFTAPHSPFQAPDEASPAPLPDDSARWKQGNAPAKVYAAMIERMDLVTGRILAALDELRLTDRTIVVFTSDNGGTRSARPTGLRDIKGTTFEGGIRVPCLVRWPGVVPAGQVVTAPFATFDLSASFARVAGVSAPAGRAFDGLDVLDALAHRADPPARDLFWRQRRGDRTWRAIREGPLKLVVRADGPDRTEFLFDLTRDESEKNDLLATRPADAARLREKLAAWELRVKPVR
jgi:N-acetylgalactosamine-6-sulfatase